MRLPEMLCRMSTFDAMISPWSDPDCSSDQFLFQATVCGTASPSRMTSKDLTICERLSTAGPDESGERRNRAYLRQAAVGTRREVMSGRLRYLLAVTSHSTT